MNRADKGAKCKRHIYHKEHAGWIRATSARPGIMQPRLQKYMLARGRQSMGISALIQRPCLEPCSSIVYV